MPDDPLRTTVPTSRVISGWIAGRSDPVAGDATNQPSVPFANGPSLPWYRLSPAWAILPPPPPPSPKNVAKVIDALTGMRRVPPWTAATTVKVSPGAGRSGETATDNIRNGGPGWRSAQVTTVTPTPPATKIDRIARRRRFR